MIRKIFKFDSKYLVENKLEVNISLDDAIKRDLLIGIGESQMTKWLDDLNGVNGDVLRERYGELKSNRSLGLGDRKVLTQQMRELEFVKELVQVEFNRVSDFDKVSKGFKVNGAEFTWLMSKGGNTITFIKKEIEPTIRVKLNNGRDLTKQFIPAKLNAYLGLTMSSSAPVSHPTGKVIIVDDAKSTFTDTYLSVTSQGVKEVTEEITLEASDGNGLISPRLMQTWSDELGYDHMSSGFTIRNSFIKGLVVPFPMDEFFAEHNIQTIVDIYGVEHSTDNIDLILTASMFKLWQSYNNYKEYETNCLENGYTFRVCKESHEITSSRANYQMTTDMELTDEQIKEMLQPSIDHLGNITGRDWLSTVLYLNGQSLTENTKVNGLEQALMVEPRLINDKHIIGLINKMVFTRKQELCLGRFNVSSSYQIICSDPYHLMQSACGIDGKGLLKKGEIFTKWHIDNGCDKVVLYRSPMISKENIAQQTVTTNNKMEQYYRYITELVVLNDWDLTCEQLAGADKDGDSVMCLADKTLNEAFVKTLPVKCEAVKGTKVVCDTVKPLITASKLGCNDKYSIGTCINHITCMFSKRSLFPVDSEEYKELSRRALMGLMISQSYIDFKKLGQVVMEMPKHWYSLKHCQTEFDKRICADKKSYFMLYNPENSDVKRKFNEWKNRNNIKTLAHWNITFDELLELDDLLDEQKQFIEYVETTCPIQLLDNSTQHRICKQAEQMLKESARTSSDGEDYSSLLKCTDVEVDKVILNKAKKAYTNYLRKVKQVQSKKYYGEERKVQEHKNWLCKELQDELVLDLLELCDRDRKVLTNILVDITYNSASSILWDNVGDVIAENLLKLNNNTITIPMRDVAGEYEYLGRKFNIKTVVAK